MEDTQPNTELKGAEEQPLPTESPEALGDYNLSKPHEIENVDSTEAPTNEDEDAGGRVSLCNSPSCPGTCFVNQTGLELTEICLALSPKCWD